MTFPNFPDKHAEDALVRPENFRSFLRSVGKLPTIPIPESVILCYQSSLYDWVREQDGTYGDGYLIRMFLPDAARGTVGVLGGFGIGAPRAAVLLEDLIGFGVRRFLSLGTAGSLQPDLGIGDLVVCGGAIRDEGVSHHYLPPAKLAHPCSLLTGHLEEALRRTSRTFRTGLTWTIDAPYRETIAEVRHYGAEGVLTVEMEAAALFAVAACRGVPLAAAFSISDSLAELAWNPRFGSPATRAGLETLYEAALEALGASAGEA